MSSPTFELALRLRAFSTGSTAIGMVLVIVMVGALFPAVGGSIGKLDLPEGVTELLGGADYGTLAGWMRSEIGAVYGPLVIAARGDHRRGSAHRRRGGGGHHDHGPGPPGQAFEPGPGQGRGHRRQRRRHRTRDLRRTGDRGGDRRRGSRPR